MCNMLKKSTIILVLGIGLFILNGTNIEAATLNVPADYATITLAIAAASNGDTIQVAAGTYSEDVTISKEVTIQGAGAGNTTIPGTGCFE